MERHSTAMVLTWPLFRARGGWRRMVAGVLLSGSGLLCGCAAVSSRVTGEGCFQGVRCDYAEIFEREGIDPGSRIHPALAAIDLPFSLAGDILFLPYDAWENCDQATRDKTVSF